MRTLVACLLFPSAQSHTQKRVSHTLPLRKSLTLLGLAALLLGCADTVQPIAQPPEGYDAIRFLRTVVVRDHAVNDITFAAGSVFLSDRLDTRGKFYCGQFQVGVQVIAACLKARAPQTLILVHPLGFEIERPLPAGTFEFTKVKVGDK